MSKLYKIGITGNICSGKSSMIKYMSQKNNSISINLDDSVANIYDRNLFIMKMFKKNFDKENSLFLNVNKLNETFLRKELGKIVFNDDNKLNTLNKIMKSELKYKLNHEINKIEYEINNNNRDNNNKYFLFVEYAMLIEAGFNVINYKFDFL
jgi:dephospho-CoA kinase